SVAVNKAGLTLTGATGNAADVVIDPPGTADGITVSAGNVTVSGLRVTGAGTGIVAANVTPLTLSNLLLDGNTTGFTANNLTTLNLIDLTLTGNTGPTSTVSSGTTINFTPTTGGTGVTSTITPGSFQRGTDEAVNYTDVPNPTVCG